jgi:hypothetical protein
VHAASWARATHSPSDNRGSLEDEFRRQRIEHEFLKLNMIGLTGHSPRVSPALQRADHVTIFLVIVGTATSAFLLAARGRYAAAYLIVPAAMESTWSGWMLTSES